MKLTIPHASIPTCAYRDILFNRFTVAQLRDAAEVFDLRVKQSASKRQLADAIEKAWLEQTEAMLLVFPQMELLSLQRLVETNGYLVGDGELETVLLDDFLVIQVEDDLDEMAYDTEEGDTGEIRYAMAKNLREAIAPVITKVVNDARVLLWDQKSKWLMDLLECYGVLSLTDLERISRKVTGKPITILDVQFLLFKRNLREFYVTGFLKNDELYLASGLVHDPEALFDNIQKRKDVSHAIYPKDSYLKQDVGLMTSSDAAKATDALLIFLRKCSQNDEHLADILLVILWNTLQKGTTIEDAAIIVTMDLTPLSPTQHETLKHLIADMAALMPLWVLKGHTPKALGITYEQVFDTVSNANTSNTSSNSSSNSRSNTSSNSSSNSRSNTSSNSKPIKPVKSKQTAANHASIYQLRIQLEDVEPPIWRCLLVPSNMELEDLHKVIQVSMGWTNSHMHEFRKGEQAYMPSWELEEDFINPSAGVAYEGVCLHQLLKRKNGTLQYEYDFGDSWEHQIVLEDIQPHREGIELPICLDGARHCPPEDCGGLFGYQALLNILKKPKHPEYKHTKNWLGSHFDPEAFDREEVNDLLKGPNYGLIDWGEGNH